MELAKHYTVGREQVGLSEKTPFRLSTLHYGQVGRAMPPGDRPDAEEMQSLTIFRPERPDVCNISAHKHSFYEIALIRRGAGLHHSPLGTVELSRGDVIVLTPDGVHAYESIRGAVKTNIYLQPEWLFEGLRPLWSEEGLVRHLLADALFDIKIHDGVFHMRTLAEETDEWEHELEALEQEAAKAHPSLSYFNGCFLKVLAILNRAFVRDENSADLPLDPIVWKAAERIEQIITNVQPLNLGELSRQIGISAIHFSRVFREHTGHSPTDYYQKRRIQHGARALMNPNVSITEIAHNLGFADSSHFARIFKRIKGESPKEYRRRRQEAYRQVS